MSARKSIFFAIIACLVATVVTGCGSNSSDTKDVGHTMFEFVGRIDQDGEKFTFYGYVSRAKGVPDDVLFSNKTTHNESTARVTLMANASLNNRAVLENVFALDAHGDTDYFYNETPGAKFDDRSTFSKGTKIGTGSSDFHNIITVTSPNQAISSGSGEESFPGGLTLNSGGKSYTLVPKGAQVRISADGFGTRLEPVAPRATILVAGEMVAIAK